MLKLSPGKVEFPNSYPMALGCGGEDGKELGSPPFLSGEHEKLPG